MSVKRNLNDKMAPTKLPVTTAVIIEVCAKPSNTTSYIKLSVTTAVVIEACVKPSNTIHTYCYLHFFTSN